MLSVTLKMYLFAGEERYSAAVRLEGWLKTLQWPCFSHQYLLVFCWSCVRHREQKNIAKCHGDWWPYRLSPAHPHLGPPLIACFCSFSSLTATTSWPGHERINQLLGHARIFPCSSEISSLIQVTFSGLATRL